MFVYIYIYIYTTHISVLRVKVQVDWIATPTIFSTVGCRGGLNNVCSSIDGEWFFSTEVSAWDMSACWLLALPGHLLCASLLPDVCKRGCRRWCQHHISPLKKKTTISPHFLQYIYTSKWKTHRLDRLNQVLGWYALSLVSSDPPKNTRGLTQRHKSTCAPHKPSKR